jgi:purine-binding chemotaxis protein CheW
MESQQFCTFLLAGYLFGVPVPRVQEVIRFQPMTPVPLAPTAVRGMINLRGQIVLAIDLRLRLSLGERPEGDLPMNVVVRTADGAVSLLVDQIGDVIDVQPSTFEPPPETLRGPLRQVILGVHKLAGNLLHVLDAEKACHVLHKQEASAS